MQRGFSMVEVVIVLGIFAIVVATGIIFSMDQIARGTVFSERDMLVSLLQSARAAALANVNAKPHGVHLDTANFVVFEGSTYSSSDPKNYPVPRTGAVVVTGPTDVIFDQLSGEALSAGSYTLNDSGKIAAVEVNAAGRIDW